MEQSIEKSHYVTKSLVITIGSVLTEPYENYQISLYI